jgi:hypothetical protein
MSSSEHGRLTQPVAIIIGAIIGACAVIAAAVIGVAFGKFEINLGGVVNPTATTDSKITSGLPAPQPTYTLLSTYTPYPTFTPNRVVATQGPITITPTPGADQQIPAPGSIILAGQGYARNGVTMVMQKKTAA